ncbi:MAG TPA: thiosulfate oxidation carrier complex protein SoxZ [Sedimenticola sp.]|nr:thiosulfate oxidation carrier complex protein SoxZ [Sedimenticola sp.]
MPKKSIEIRAKHRNGITTVNALMVHPMEPGIRGNGGNGNPVSAHFIQEVICEYREAVLLRAQWGPSISRDPYLSFSFKGGAKGEKIRLSWVDNRGGSDSAETEIK